MYQLANVIISKLANVSISKCAGLPWIVKSAPARICIFMGLWLKNPEGLI